MAFSVDGPVTIEIARELHPGAIRAREAVAREAGARKIAGIRHKTEEAAKRAFIIERMLEDIFHRAGLLTLPSTTDPTQLNAYLTRLEYLCTSKGGKELIDRLQHGWKYETVFSATHGSIVIFFRVPDMPNTICVKNFNIEDSEVSQAQQEMEKKQAEEERATKMARLREKLDTFHTMLENMLSLSIPRDFTEAYISFREAIAPKDGDLPKTFEMLPPHVRRYADFFAGTILDALMLDTAQARQLPDPKQILALYQIQMDAFNYDVLRLKHLPARLVSWGELTLSLEPTETQKFQQALLPLQ